MATRWGHSKRIVADVGAAERFYAALGFITTDRRVGGGGDDRTQQEQTYMSTTGDQRSHQLVLCRFPAFPPPPRPVYPGEGWLCIGVADVDEACDEALRHGGSIFRAGEDTEHGVRAAVITDADGHFIELVGPLRAG